MHQKYEPQIPTIFICTLSLQWCQVERDGISNHQRLGCFLNCLFRRRSKKTSKLCVTGLCEGNFPMNYPHKGPVTWWHQWRHECMTLKICSTRHPHLYTCKTLCSTSPSLLNHPDKHCGSQTNTHTNKHTRGNIIISQSQVIIIVWNHVYPLLIFFKQRVW